MIDCVLQAESHRDKEEYYVTQRYGLVQWIHYVFVNGAYGQLQRTVLNQMVAGVVTPDFHRRSVGYCHVPYNRCDKTDSSEWGDHNFVSVRHVRHAGLDDLGFRSAIHLSPGGDEQSYLHQVEPGKFYWVKGGLGYPWDIKLYDNNYIYLWITELSFSVPHSYKKFTNNTNVPLVPRCATAGNPGSTIKVANTKYDLHTNCSNTCSQKTQPYMTSVIGIQTISNNKESFSNTVAGR